MTLLLQAQTREVGFLVGASNYHGDLADEVVFNESHFSGGLFFRHNFNQYWAYRQTLSYMHISGNDANFDAYKLRNLSFYTDIYEYSHIIEFNYQPFSQLVFHQNQTIYAFLGVAGYYFNPKTRLNDKEYVLHDMNTENIPTDERYKRFQISVPFGLGYKYAVTKNLLLGFEVGWRKTFTDYLDDVSTVYPDLDELDAIGGRNSRQLSDRSWEVSDNGTQLYEMGDQRGDPNLKDWYIQAGFTVSYRFTPIKCWAE